MVVLIKLIWLIVFHLYRINYITASRVEINVGTVLGTIA